MEKTLEERRIEIIKDAIAQISANKYIPTQGEVVGYELKIEARENTDEEVTSLQPILLEFLKENTCDVCQRGQLLLSTIALENKFDKHDLRSANGYFYKENLIDMRLMEVFTEETLMMAECAFEAKIIDIFKDDSNSKIVDYDGQEYHYYETSLSRETFLKCVKFGMQFSNLKRRSLVILHNMLENGGEFKP